MPFAKPRLESAQLFVYQRCWSLQSQDVNSVIRHGYIVIFLSAIERARIKIGFAGLVNGVLYRLVNAGVEARRLMGAVRVIDRVESVAHGMARARHHACLS